MINLEFDGCSIPLKSKLNLLMMSLTIRNSSPFVWMILAVGLISCNDQKSSGFKHDIQSQATPWTSEPTPNQADQFTFAIISDLNGEERPGIFNVAAEQLKLLRPEFIMSVGDLIDGGTEDTIKLREQFDFVDSRVKKTETPFF